VFPIDSISDAGLDSTSTPGSFTADPRYHHGLAQFSGIETSLVISHSRIKTGTTCQVTSSNAITGVPPNDIARIRVDAYVDSNAKTITVHRSSGSVADERFQWALRGLA